MSDQFKPLPILVDSDKPRKEEDDTRLFQLNEFLESTSKLNRDFTFDSDTARNFDKDNVNRAKEGVKELMADAIAKAKTQAIEIKNQALKEGKSTGHEEGFQAGFEEGKSKAKEEFDPLLKTLNQLILDLSEFRKMMFPKAENEMVGMIVDLVKKVLHHEMNLREDGVKEMILLAMNSVVNKENMVIRVHPSDKKYAEEFCPKLKGLFGEIKNINFEAHSGIKRGGCIIETNFGTVDAEIDQLDEQIEKILNFTPTVPEIDSTAKVLAENASGTGAEEILERDSDITESKLKTEENGENPIGTTSGDEVGKDLEYEMSASGTPTKETAPEEISEPVLEDIKEKHKTETEKNVVIPTDATFKGETEESLASETPVSESPAPEKEPEETPEKPEDLTDFKKED